MADDTAAKADVEQARKAEADRKAAEAEATEATLQANMARSRALAAMAQPDPPYITEEQEGEGPPPAPAYGSDGNYAPAEPPWLIEEQEASTGKTADEEYAENKALVTEGKPVQDMTKAELSAAAKAHGLSTAGNVDDLRGRLLDAGITRA